MGNTKRLLQCETLAHYGWWPICQGTTRKTDLNHENMIASWISAIYPHYPLKVISKPNCKSFQTQQSAVFINWNHTFKKAIPSLFAIFAFCFRLALYGPLCIEWSTKLFSQTNTFWPLFLPVPLILDCFSLFTILIYDTILFFVYCSAFLCSFTLTSKWR